MTSKEREQRQLAPIKSALYVKAPAGQKLRDRKVTRLAQKLRTAMPWLEPSDEPAVRAWAQLEILGTLAFAELRANGITAGNGEPRRLLAEFRQLRTAQLAYERQLGMTPTARMMLPRQKRTPTLREYLTEKAARGGQ
jgi:hypothetical protein